MRKRRQKVRRRRNIASGRLTVAVGPVLGSLALAPLLTTALLSPAHAAGPAGTVTFIPIDTGAYGTNDLNSVGISRDNLATVGNYQYTAYYKWVSNSTGDIVVGRRATNSSSWTLVTTPYAVTIGQNGVAADAVIGTAIDDHDVVAMAVDGNGDMHLSWGMHNVPLNYAISTPVNGATFAPAFTTQNSTNNPNLFAEFASTGVYQATYPEFYYIPNGSGAPSGNLLFDIRNANTSSGGGSGDGNTYFSIFNTSSGYSAAPLQVLNGGVTHVNGYQNNLTYDHAGNLLYSWTWRSSSNWQTNQNILFAQSNNSGQTWTQQGGGPTYTLPILSDTSKGGSASQVAQVIKSIPQNSSLINTTGMTVDANNNPIIATWFDPNGTSPSTGNPNRQYELVYYTGTQWKTSQISNRTTDTAFDTTGNDVRDLGRPLVMVDPQGRVLVVTRSDNAMGAFTNSSGSGNNIVVYWNTIASLDSASPNAWQPITLDSANMGEWEPSMDYNLWNSTSILDLFYEPSGFTSQTTGNAQVLQWNEQAYFAVATPASVTWNTSPSGLLDGSGTWDGTHLNWAYGGINYVWNNSYSVNATFGVSNGAAGVVTLGGNITATTLTFNPAGSGNYNVAGGGFTLSLASGATITANTNATISAPLSVTGNLTKLGAGTLTLSGTNTFSGTINLGSTQTSGGNVNGALRITSAAAVAGVTQISFADGSAAYDVFQIDGSSGNITLPSSLAFNMNGAATIANSNVIENIAGNNIINGTITPNVYGNQYTVQSDAGTLTINSAFSLGSLTSARYLNLAGAGNGNWVGVLSNGSGNGPLGLTKLGSGAWTLSNVELYTGLTNVSAGSLIVAGGASLASPNVNVSSGATLTAYGSLISTTALVANGTVNFEPNTVNSILARSLASLNIGATGQVAVVDASNHSSRTVLVLTSYHLTGTTNTWQGRLDLGNNDLIIRTGSIGDITNQVNLGYNAGAWNGSAGIASAGAASDSTHLTALAVVQNTIDGSTTGSAIFSTFDGISVSKTDVLVKYTYYGDVNLDGVIDGTDYSRIDTAHGTTLSGWYNGDFNYDGAINGSDYTLIDNAFNTQGVHLTSEIASIASQVAGSTAAVPEPAVLAIPAVASALLRRRRTRQKVSA